MNATGCRVAVLMGGMSEEREVSLQTGACVASALARSFRVKPVEIRADGAWVAAPGFTDGSRSEAWRAGEGRPALEALSRLSKEIDAVFNALHGPWGEDGAVQGLLRYARIPFTGPDLIPAAVTMDKCLTKETLRGVGIETPRSFGLPRREGIDWKRFVEERSALVPFPWIAKPRRLGSSVGVRVFADGAAFLEWIESALTTGRISSSVRDEGLRLEDLFVEEVVAGRELTCGVLETDGEALALPPIEIRPRASAFFDYGAKYTPGATEEICPAPLSAEETRAVERCALRVHEIFGCAPLSRTDIFLTQEGTLTVLEVNTLPGMTETSLIPLAARRAGISLEALFTGLVEHALARAHDARGVLPVAREGRLARCKAAVSR